MEFAHIGTAEGDERRRCARGAMRTGDGDLEVGEKMVLGAVLLDAVSSLTFHFDLIGPDRI